METKAEAVLILDELLLAASLSSALLLAVSIAGAWLPGIVL